MKASQAGNGTLPETLHLPKKAVPADRPSVERPDREEERQDQRHRGPTAEPQPLQKNPGKYESPPPVRPARREKQKSATNKKRPFIENKHEKDPIVMPFIAARNAELDKEPAFTVG